MLNALYYPIYSAERWDCNAITDIDAVFETCYKKIYKERYDTEIAVQEYVIKEKNYYVCDNYGESKAFIKACKEAGVNWTSRKRLNQILKLQKRRTGLSELVFPSGDLEDDIRWQSLK